MRLQMRRRASEAETRGAGPAARVDAFRARVRGGWLAAITLAVLGIFALIAPVLDLGQARQDGHAIWLVPSGIILLVTAGGLGWFAAKNPVVLTIGPEGLYHPLAFTNPLGWNDIWRMQCFKSGGWLRGRRAMLVVDLAPGAMAPYKRWARSVPFVDRWLIRKFGLRVPLQHLDAESETVILSLERFRPVKVVVA
jgi:hypothetical protein